MIDSDGLKYIISELKISNKLYKLEGLKGDLLYYEHRCPDFGINYFIINVNKIDEQFDKHKDKITIIEIKSYNSMIKFRVGEKFGNGIFFDDEIIKFEYINGVFNIIYTNDSLNIEVKAYKNN